MKTIPELSVSLGLHRDTLRKAAIRGEFPARKAGERTYIIDDESPEFKEWLQSRERKFSEMTKWIEHENYYAYPVEYTSQTRAFKSAQRLSNKLGIFAETMASAKRTRDGKQIFCVVTRNDVPHD